LASDPPEVCILSHQLPKSVARRGPLSTWIVRHTLTAATRLARILPTPAAYAIADGCGMATFYVWRTGRRNALSNFAHVLGLSQQADQVRRIARRSFCYHLRMGVDVFKHLSLSDERLRQELVIEGASNLSLARERGKGVILVAPHLGNWEAGVNANCFLGDHQAIAVVDEGLLPDLVARSRDRARLALVHRSKSLRPVLRTLASNGIVVLVSDLALDMRSVSVQFFGRTSHVPVGPALLARKTGASLMPLYAIRNHEQKTRVVFESPFVPTLTESVDDDLRTISQWMTNFFERVIRENLEQWYPYQQYWTDHATAP